MKYHLITYGCQMNTADAQEMAQPLKNYGFTATGDPAEADAILMNTCTVREHAEHKALSNLGRLRQWKAENPDRILIVAGCAATLWGDSLKKKYPFVDLVSPATQIEQFPDVIAKVLKERSNFDHRQEEALLPMASDPVTPSPAVRSSATPFWFGSPSTAYVTIMRGCNLNCSYCIVPQVRGREKYRPLFEIIEEIVRQTQAGSEEIMLLGQTVNSYYWRDSTGVYDFADLLRVVNDLSGVKTIRFMSPHPKHMRERTLEALKDCFKVARHVHLPVQSGSDPVLSRMKRLYTREEYLEIVRQLRVSMPGVAITTDVIVGYPGESETDFALTLSLIKEARFDGLFAFKYSPRPGTLSADEPDDVSEEVKEERHARVLNYDAAAQNEPAAVPAW